MGGGDSNGAMGLVAYPEQMNGYSGIGYFLLDIRQLRLMKQTCGRKITIRTIT